MRFIGLLIAAAVAVWVYRCVFAYDRIFAVVFIYTAKTVAGGDIDAL